MPEPMHDKRKHWIELADLEAVGLALLADARRPVTTHRSRVRQYGLQRALAHQRSLMLRLLVRIPMLQRQLRECQLEKHLYRDAHGIWQLEFSGQDLKRERKSNGKLNTFRFRFPDDLVPHLEEYLQQFRPLIPRADTAVHLFLTKNGNPYTRSQLRRELTHAVYQYTGRRVYPHLVRTIRATRCIKTRKEFTTAAYGLGDTEATVQKYYQELLDEEHQQDASDFVQHELARRTPFLQIAEAPRKPCRPSPSAPPTAGETAKPPSGHNEEAPAA